MRHNRHDSVIFLTLTFLKDIFRQEQHHYIEMVIKTEGKSQEQCFEWKQGIILEVDYSRISSVNLEFVNFQDVSC